jgi:phosphoglycolate phosphatase
MVNLKLDNDVIEGIELVIFDRDGTLIDLYAYWSWMIAKRAELICSKLKLQPKHKKGLMFAMGIDERNKRIRPEGPVGLKKREIVMQAAIDYLLSLNLRDVSDICLESFQEVNKLSFDNLENIIKPLNGLYGLFDDLVRNSCKIAIATTDKTDRARLAMDFLKLTHKIDVIVGENDVKEAKPAPDMAYVILERLNVKKDRAVMVGDAVTDIQMGRNAGLKASIAVLTGLAPEDELEKFTSYVIESIEDIKVES